MCPAHLVVRCVGKRSHGPFCCELYLQYDTHTYIKTKAAPETVASVIDKKHSQNKTNNICQDPQNTNNWGKSVKRKFK